MRITITKDFDTLAEAAAFLSHVSGANHVDIVTAMPGAQEAVEAANKTRKPRADAGKKREPYGPRATTTEVAGTTASSTTAGGTPAVQAAAGAGGATSVVSEGSPASSTAAAASTNAAPVTPLDANVDFPATLEGARKAMAALNATAGRGMDACIQALKAAGVNRISDLPKEQYADFIKSVLVQSSKEGIEVAKKAPAAKK